MTQTLKVQIPMNMVRTTDHNGNPVIKPKEPAVGWKNRTESGTIYEDQGTALLTGKINNITVLDFDNEDIYQKFLTKFPMIPNTQMVKSPHGYHAYYAYTDTLSTTSYKTGELAGLDIRNDRGLIISPPSYQIDLRTNKKMYYGIINKNKRIEMPDEVIQYILENSVITTNKTTKDKYLQPYNGETYFVPNLDLIKQALDKIKDNDTKWFPITNAIKGLLNTENSEELMTMWDRWSMGHPKYNKENNLSIFNNLKYVIHPNYIFKLAGMNKKIFKRPYTEPEIKFDYTVNEQFVSNCIKNVPKDVLLGDYAIKSTTGTGKTYYMAEQVKSKYMNKKVMMITNRRSLSEQMVKSFSGSGFKHYQDNDMLPHGEINNYMNHVTNAKLIIQINSLFKLSDIPDGCILILDEYSSLCKYLVSGNISKLENVYVQFITLLKKAEQVICIDGDLDQYCIDFLNHFRTTPIKLIKNEYKNATGINCTITQNIDAMYEQIQSKLKEDRLTVHCADTKNMVKQINNKLGEFGVKPTDIKSYHSDSKEDKKDLSDVNKSWNGKHVTFSPSIVTGVDYTADTRSVFLYCNASGQTYNKYKTINARDMAQQVARSRLQDDLFIYMDTKACKPEFETFEEFKANYLIIIKENNDHLSSLMTTFTEDIGITFNDNAFTELLLRYKFEDMMIQSDQENYLIERLRQKGYSVFFLNEPKASVEELGCKHENIDEYLEYLKNPQNNKKPNSVLFENVQKRMQILAMDDIDLHGLSDNKKNMLCCGRAVRHYLDFIKLTKLDFKYEQINLTNVDTNYHKIQTIRSILDAHKLTVSDLANPETQFGESKIDKESSKVFKKTFGIKNKIDYSVSRNKLIPKLSKVINECTFMCSSFGDQDKLFEVSKEQKQIRVGVHRNKRYYPIKINQKYLDLIDELMNKPKFESKCLIDDLDEIVPDE